MRWVNVGVDYRQSSERGCSEERSQNATARHAERRRVIINHLSSRQMLRMEMEGRRMFLDGSALVS